MSQGRPMPHAEANATALRILRDLAPGCERIEIAGSLRRDKAEVRDIELVAVPRIEQRQMGMFTTLTEPIDALDERLALLLGAGALQPRPVENHRADGSIDVQTKLGPSFKALMTGTGVPVDLFIVRPPAQWGAIFAIRTGPGDWNTRLVTDCQAIGRRLREGHVEAWTPREGWQPVPTPEETDFFRAIGQEWIEPRDRHVDRVRIQRATASQVGGHA